MMSSDPSSTSPRLQAALVRWFTERCATRAVRDRRRARVIVWNRWMELHSRSQRRREVLGRSLLELYPDLASARRGRYYRERAGRPRQVISHGLHRYLLPLPADESRRCGFAQMPQSGRIGPLSDGGVIVGTVTHHRRRQRPAGERERAAKADRGAEAGARDRRERAAREGRIPVDAVARDPHAAQRRARLDAHPPRPRGRSTGSCSTRALRVIDRNAAAQARMIDDMLDMARIVGRQAAARDAAGRSR